MVRLAGSLDVPNFSFPCLETPAFELLTQSDAGQSKIIVIVAPTGYGKTVLMASWCERLQDKACSTFWVCLDERDKQITPLFARIERQLFAEATSLNPFEAVHESDLPFDQRIENILQAIRAIPGESYLFIDNLNFCEDEALSPLLRALLEETPDHFHLVLAGIQEPPLSLGRATLEGKVCRIGFLDLALREAEVRALLGESLAESVGDCGVKRIVELSEGWPAAVRLMQIVLSNEPDSQSVIQGFAGSDVELAEMLNRQVLLRLDDKFRRFLLEISQLRTFNEEMCCYALGSADSAKYIRQLLHNNLFIIPLDRNRTKYRLHGLFGGFLKTEARKVLPAERLKQVLIKASEWCEANKEFADAIDYATSAGSLVHAAAILDRVAASFVRDRGDLSKYISWVEQLRESSVALEWDTEFWYLWALVFHRRYDFAARQLAPLRNRLESGEVSKEDDRYTDYVRRLEIISITIDTYTDKLSEADAQAVSWLEGSLEDDPFDVATIATAAGIYGASHFEFASARKYFAIAQSRIAQAQSIYGEAWVTAASSFVGLHEGKFSETYEIAERIVAKVRANIGGSSGIASTCASVAARCAVELGQDSEAQRYLEIALENASVHGVVDSAALGLEAAVKLWASPMGRDISIVNLRDIASSYPPRLSLMLSCFLTQRLLRLAQLDDAIEEAAKIGLGGKLSDEGFNTLVESENRNAYSRYLLSITQIELDLAQGRLRQAKARIAKEVTLARSQGRNGHMVDLCLCEMTFILRSPNPADAVKSLTKAISYAAKRGYIRPFIDRANLIASLVNESQSKNWGFALAEEKEFFAKVCKFLPIANSLLLEKLDNLDQEVSLLETPTPRELELLALIEAGLTNQQLADRLSLSVPTVKWHLYNLYNKLGVSSRAAALAKGRVLNLVGK